MNKKQTLKNWVISAMIEELQEKDGQSSYGSDLGYNIFESANINGSYTCSTYESKQWIKKYWEDLGEVVEEIKINLGEDSIPNVFDNPEAFQVVIMLEISSQLCGQCKIIEQNWNNNLELNKKTINIIKKELKSLKD